MLGRNRVPSFQLASGTTDERDYSYNNVTTLGSIFTARIRARWRCNTKTLPILWCGKIR